MTDSTQELDEILNVLYMQGEDIGRLEYGSATHQITAVNGAKQATLDWHNKQTEGVLDRLEAQFVEEVVVIFGKTEVKKQVPLSAIEAERNRLNPSKSTPFNKPKESSND